MKNLRFNEIAEDGTVFSEIVNEIEQETGMDCDWDTTDRLSQAGHEYGYYFGHYVDVTGEIYEAMLSEPNEIIFIKR
jgi:hypothetical protein